MNVRILKAQRINRVWYEVDDIAVFSEREAVWLIGQRIAESIDATAVPVAPRPSAPRAPMPRPQFVQQKPSFKCCGWNK